VAREDYSTGEFNGVAISKWNRAQVIGQHSYVLNQAMWQISIEMWNNPEFCLPFVQTLHSFWSKIYALAIKKEAYKKKAEAIDASFPKAFETALTIPHLSNGQKIVSETYSLIKFGQDVDAFAQEVGWGLPENKKEVSEEDLLSKLSE
jgi:hypothetical protein